LLGWDVDWAQVFGDRTPGGTVLGIVWRENSGALRRLERVSLRSASRPVPIGRDDSAWSFSSDHSRLALAGGEPLEVRIVDVLRPRPCHR
jgi:hypothetical protein